MTGATEALESLCAKYRPPLYAFLRAQHFQPADADDFVQGFFQDLLLKDGLRKADPAKGKFRTWLLRRLTWYLCNAWDKDHARKRGGGLAHVQLKRSDTATGEGVAPPDPNGQREFERAWASALIWGVLGQLKARYHESGKGELFETLHPLLVGEGEHGEATKAAAAKLGLAENAVRQAVFRLRQNYRELLLAEVTKTVEDPSEAEEEIRYLFTVFQKP